ncbi:radical SAM protein [Candidatus Poribacteria bacterium]|nr:radical SAM protein [Candidatus Poribacteria bacterium]
MTPLPPKSKILLLNLPGKRLYVRDYYCSKTSKTNYLFAPCDLLLLSGRLAANHEVRLIDCIAERLSDEKCLSRVSELNPRVIVFLAGAVSWNEDSVFLERLRKLLPETILIGSGDVFLESGEELLRQNPSVDAGLLDFSSDDLVTYLDGGAANNMVVREGGSIKVLPVRRGAYEKFALPIPRHELFMNRAYRLPFLNSPFATVLTDFGCPFKCSFCVMSTLGYRYREVKNILEELSLIRSLGISNIFFLDQTFRPKRSDNVELCREMLGRNFRFNWICYSRVDVVDEDVLVRMKDAGCRTIIFGVESASSRILVNYKKGYTIENVREVFSLCKKLGIRTVGTFIVGLPEETEETCRATIELACELDCDYASFNFVVPRAGTVLRSQAVAMGLVNADIRVMDQSGTFIAMPTSHLSTEQLRRLRTEAIVKYYLRPKYLAKRLRSLSSFQELRENAYAAISLFRNLLA